MTKSNFLRTKCSEGKNAVCRVCTYFCFSLHNLFVVLNIGILIVLVSNLLSAQTTGKISGVITDAQTGEPLIGANVVIIGTSLGASTDIEGAFFILNIPAGKYDIQVSMVGYEKVMQRDLIVNSGRTATADFKIKSTTIEQDVVLIEHERLDVEPERTSTAAIIRNEDVQQLAGMRDVGDVIGLAADVTDGHFRGGREGEELYTLQGMGIVNPLDNTTGLLPIMSAVEEVEVITSGFGAQYGNAQSGVVNITMKEGKSDKWRSHAELNTRLPDRKYFGANVYDLNANRYLQTLLSESVWRSAGEGGEGYWTQMGPLSNMLGRDTALQIRVARALYANLRKNINNTSYEKNRDYSLEFSTGGPISEGVRMFLAVRNSTTWPKYPVEHPDVNQQIMGNIVTDVGNGSSLRISGAYGQNTTSRFPSENSSTSPGYLHFLWDNILGVQLRTVTNTQIGLRFTEALSHYTFYEIKLNTLMTTRREGSSAWAEFRNPRENLNINSLLEIQSVKPPDGFRSAEGQDNFYNNKTNTYSLDVSLTSQVTKSHLANVGVQANLYYLNVREFTNMTNDPPYYNEYSAHPYEVAIFVQDKMEFHGMIANIGLRWDVWSMNSKYNPDIYTPYINDTLTGTAAFNTKTPVIGRLQPRVGISFPVSVNTVFHINYGSFIQRPSFQYLFDARNQMASLIKPSQLGNATLKPQTTYSYDVGVMQGFGEGFTLDVSGYYKNVLDLVQQATFAESGTNSYDTYINRAYADIRGFRIVLNKRKGNFIGSLNYQYSVATGKSSTVGTMTPTFTRGQPDNLANTSLKDILLDFDREHNVLLNLGYVSDENFGIRIGNIYPLGDMSVSSISFFRSGRPYTYNEVVGGFAVNNKRTPWEYNTNVKISKRIRNFFGTEASLYVEVFNLFDNTILNYDYIFRVDVAGSSNPQTAVYETQGINALRYMNDAHQSDPLLAMDKAFLLYSNQPRSINLGFSIDL